METPEIDSLPPAHPLRQVFEMLRRQRRHLPPIVQAMAADQDLRDLMPKQELPGSEKEPDLTDHQNSYQTAF